MLAERDAVLVGENGFSLPSNEALEVIGGLDSDDKKEASVRWAVAVGDKGELRLNLVTLPASANTINNRPLLKSHSKNIPHSQQCSAKTQKPPFNMGPQ